MGSSDATDRERPLNRVVLHLNPALSQLVGSPTVYEDEVLNVLTEKGLITAVSREKGLGGGDGSGANAARLPGRESSPGLAAGRLPRTASAGATLPGKEKSFKRVATNVLNAFGGKGFSFSAKNTSSDQNASQQITKKLTARDRWRLAVKHTKEMAKLHSFDPWWDRELHQLRSELCVRYDYDPETKEWVRFGAATVRRGGRRESA